MPIPALRSGRWCEFTVACCAASRRAGMMYSPNACGSLKLKKQGSCCVRGWAGTPKIMSSKSVIVIGGGLAGLSSAVALAEAGLRVRLLEKRPHLGGRAASYILPDGEHVDNCQHVTLGCCTNLEDFYRRVGAADKIRFFSRLQFAAPNGRRGALAASPLPAPLHMAPSFALFPLLDWADKSAIARALLKIARSGGHPADLAVGGAGITMLVWLQRQRQTDRAIRRFWEVILVSALDEEL